MATWSWYPLDAPLFAMALVNPSLFEFSMIGRADFLTKLMNRMVNLLYRKQRENETEHRWKTVVLVPEVRVDEAPFSTIR